MAHQLTENQIKDIKEEFSTFDKKGDGTIATSDLEHILTALAYHIDNDELLEMSDALDFEGGGIIKFDDFLSMMAKKLEDTDEDVLDAFRVFDKVLSTVNKRKSLFPWRKDGDGFVAAAELRDMMINYRGSATDEEINELIEEADSNGDGQVIYKDFVKLMSVYK